jgi:hypothetical protein
MVLNSKGFLDLDLDVIQQQAIVFVSVKSSEFKHHSFWLLWSNGKVRVGSNTSQALDQISTRRIDRII